MIAGSAWLASAGGQKGLEAFGTGRSAGTGGCVHETGDGTNALSSADAEGGRLRRNVRPRRVEQGADGNALYRKRYSLQSKHLELSAKTNIDYHLPSDYCLDDRVCFCGWHFQILEYRNAKIPNLIMARLI